MHLGKWKALSVMTIRVLPAQTRYLVAVHSCMYATRRTHIITPFKDLCENKAEARPVCVNEVNLRSISSVFGVHCIPSIFGFASLRSARDCPSIIFPPDPHDRNLDAMATEASHGCKMSLGAVRPWMERASRLRSSCYRLKAAYKDASMVCPPVYLRHAYMIDIAQLKK